MAILLTANITSYTDVIELFEMLKMFSLLTEPNIQKSLVYFI